MSTTPSTAHARYRVHLDAQSVVDVDLNLDLPISQVARALAQERGRPEPYDTYNFFVGVDRRPLIRQITLRQASYTQGEELFLAQGNAPWWIESLAGGAAVSGRPGRRSTTITVSTPPPRMLAIGAVALIVVLGLIWAVLPRDSAESRGLSAQSSTPGLPAAKPTATLLAATPATLAMPTTDPAIQASADYQSGLIAYDKQDWEQASRLLQQVYDYNPSYLNITEVLSAAYYNWGVITRDQGQIAEALEHFSAALLVAPDHPLARDDQERAQRYVDAQAASASGDLAGASKALRDLYDRDPDYADVATQLYTTLIAYADTLQAEGGTSNLHAALDLYEEATELDVPDHSAAEQGIAAVEPLLPTPTPRPVDKRLRFSVMNYNDSPNCISIRVTGIGTSGWYFTVDGVGGVSGRFDTGGNARACGLGNGQEITLTIHYADGRGVPGGVGVPSKGSAIMTAPWR